MTQPRYSFDKRHMELDQKRKQEKKLLKGAGEMTGYKTAQEFIAYQSRRFHFVSYEGGRADPAGHITDLAPGWFLMLSGQRIRVLEQVDGMDRAEVRRRLTAWLADHIDRVIPSPGGPVVGEATITN